MALCWAYEYGVAGLAGSGSHAHIESNYAAADFELSTADMDRLDAERATDLRLLRNEEGAPDWAA